MFWVGLATGMLIYVLVGVFAYFYQMYKNKKKGGSEKDVRD